MLPRRIFRRSLLLAGIALFSIPSFAEPVNDTRSKAEETDEGQVVVTARRREERAQDVPVAANSFGGAQLEATRTYNLRDLPQLTPSLVVTNTNPRNTSINIRGLGNNVSVYNDGLEPAVGVYMDGVYLARPGQAVFDMADLERVEVLRGPQGTLFGKNTSAGAVVITTKSPSFTPEAGGDVSVGNFGFLQAHAYASGPITNRLAARIFVSKTERDGFVFNRFDGGMRQDFDDRSVRAQLLWQPTDDLRVRLIGDHGRQNVLTSGNQLLGALRTYDNGAPFPNNYYDRAARLGYLPVDASDPSRRIVDVDGNPRYDMNQQGLSATADLTLGDATLTSVTAYRGWNWYPHNDGDGTPLDAGTDFHQSNRQRQFSQELRIASDGSRPLTYVAGLYYLFQSIDAQAQNLYGPRAAEWFVAPTVDPVVSAAALNGYSVIGNSRPVTRSYAAFAQGVYALTPTVDLTAGLRYTYETKRGWFDQQVGGAPLDALTRAQRATALAIRARYGAANRYEASTEEGRLSGQATLSWKITPDILTYATYARGNKFGGLNLANITTTGQFAANPVIAPETIDSYELGLKTASLDGRLTANLAAFWSDVKDYQTTIVDVERNNVAFFTNAGKIRTRGIEADLAFNPVRAISLYGSGAYTDASYVDYANAPCPIEVTGQSFCDLDGRALLGVSKWAFSTGGEARAPLGENFGADAEAYLGADYSYRSDFNTSASLSRYSLVPSYSLLNLRFGIRAKDGRYDVQFWARNVLDEAYYLSIGAANTGAINATLGDPRTYGITLRGRF